MAKLSLLQMTQSVLSAMSSDEVNSISDTAESLQVANIIQQKYYDIQTRANLPDDNQLFQLNAATDITKPVLMTVPAGVSTIRWIKYYDVNPKDNVQVSQFGSYSHDLNTDIKSNNSGWIASSTTTNSIVTGSVTFTVQAGLVISVGDNATASAGATSMSGFVSSYSGTTLVLNINTLVGSGTFSSWIISNTAGAAAPGYKWVTILPIDQFLEYVNQFSLVDSNVGTYNFTESGESFSLRFKNDIQPKCCCIISNQFILFDSYNNNFDSTLQTSKTMVYGVIIPTFQMVDSFIPELDDNQFPLLLNEAKALAFYELKQMPHAKAEQEIKRQWSTIQKNKSVVNRPTYFDELSNFGRQPNTGGYGGKSPIYFRQLGFRQ